MEGALERAIIRSSLIAHFQATAAKIEQVTGHLGSEDVLVDLVVDVLAFSLRSDKACME